MHHTATLGEIDNFWTAFGGALVNAGLIWVFYVGSGALGAAQVAAHDDLLDALHHQRCFRSAGGQGPALRHRVWHASSISATPWTRRFTGTIINRYSRR